MTKKNFLQKMTMTFIAVAMILSMTGCSSSQDNKTTDAKKVTEEIMAKYAKEQMAKYTDIQKNVSRDHAFTFDLSKEAFEKFKSQTDNWNDIIGLYKDANLTKRVSYKADNDDTSVTISPFRNPEYAIPDNEAGGHLYDQGEWNDWGNAQQYYLVKYFDLLTGEKLDTPEITLFTVDTEIKNAPKVEFYISDNGIGGLRWQEVKGAKEYAVLKVSEPNDGKSSGRSVEIIKTVKDTKWEDKSDNKDKNNWNFRTVFGESLDTKYKEQKDKLDSGEITIKDFSTMQFDGESEYDKTKDLYFAVIALNEEGNSPISNLIDKRMAASKVPVELAYNMNKGGIKPTGSNSRATVDRSISLVSSHVWVIMANGNVTQKLVNYNIDKAKEDTIQIVTYEEDENGNIKVDENGKPVNYQSEDIPSLSIPFSIAGTSISGYVNVTHYDKENYKKELTELKKRQASLKDKTGDITKDINLSSDKKDDDEVAKKLNTEYSIYASTALSEYLALQMLNGETVIDVKDFKEASDSEYLLDAWYEAIYQNPLVLGVRGISYNEKTNSVSITYDQDRTEQLQKQKEIQEKVDTVVKEVIKEGMSDLEKEEAINTYLCANATYDNEALENAEKNNFKKVDEEFNDSFTAYGILINGKGVCSGYAGAFKLLADKAGLTNVVVTGYLQGSLPHAWNRVLLDDQWYSLDVTNNDNEFFTNGLFNLSDTAAKDVLTEDTLYVMDSDLTKFKASGDTNEYYHYNQKFFNQQEVVDKLVAEVKTNGKAVYRTDYTLSEEQFYDIASKVVEQTNNPDLQGGYFLGVIYLSE